MQPLLLLLVIVSISGFDVDDDLVVAVIIGGRLRNSSITDKVEIFAPWGCQSELEPLPERLENVLVGYVEDENESVLLACGGGTDDYASRNCFRYFPEERAWILYATMNVGRHNAASVTLDDGTFVITGGEQEDGVLHSTMEVWSIKKNRWIMEEMPGGGRKSHCAAKVGQGYIIAGGLAATGNNAFRSAYFFNSTSGLWTQLPDMIKAREWFACVKVKKNEVMAAGSSCCLSDETSEIFNFETLKWKINSERNRMKRGRDGLIAFEIGGKIFAVGGRFEEDSVEFFDENIGWNLFSKKLIYGRRFAGVAKVPLQFFEGNLECLQL